MPFADLIGRINRALLDALGGEIVTYQPEVGPPVEVKGVFDAQYSLAQEGAEAGVSTLGPAVFLLLEDLPEDPEHDEPTLTIRETNYRVTRRMPDGMGGIVLGLRRTG